MSLEISLMLCGLLFLLSLVRDWFRPRSLFLHKNVPFCEESVNEVCVMCGFCEGTMLFRKLENSLLFY